jgi:hypothetical protein
VNYKSERVGRMTVVEREAMSPHTAEGTIKKKNIQTKMPEKLVSGLKTAWKLT